MEWVPAIQSYHLTAFFQYNPKKQSEIRIGELSQAQENQKERKRANMFLLTVIEK